MEAGWITSSGQVTFEGVPHTLITAHHPFMYVHCHSVNSFINRMRSLSSSQTICGCQATQLRVNWEEAYLARHYH